MPAGLGRISVIGSLNADLTVTTERFPRPGETLSASELKISSGGKSSNQAIAAATLGSTVRIVGAVGDDDNGELLVREVAGNGVDVSAVRKLTDHATGSAMIVVDAHGENTILVSPGANGEVTAEMITRDAIGDADVVCLCLEIPDPAVRAAAAAGRDAGTVVLLNVSPYREVSSDLLGLTDILIVNESELCLLLGLERRPEWSEAMRFLAGRGIERAVVTCGGDGSVVLDSAADNSADRIVGIAAERVEVLDTTGCGDAYTGALAHGLAAGTPLVEAARFAARAGARAATALGAQTSYREFADLRG